MGRGNTLLIVQKVERVSFVGTPPGKGREGQLKDERRGSISGKLDKASNTEPNAEEL